MTMQHARLRRIRQQLVKRAMVSGIGLFPAVPTLGADGSERTDVGSIARGGQLYDKGWAVLGLEAPKPTHASHPAAGRRKGSGTGATRARPAAPLWG